MPKGRKKNPKNSKNGESKASESKTELQNEKRGLDSEITSNGVKKLKTDSTLNVEVKNPLEHILKGIEVSNFLENYWEKKPLVLHAKDSKPTINDGVFSKSILENLLKDEDIRFGRDIHACRCVNGVTEDKNPKKPNKVTQKDFKRLFEDLGATIQFHQPQRFVDSLWDIMEKLETQFSCLFGANTYITPVGTQGLAPHYDDVEVFIIQLEGEKHWKLYEAPVKHAREYKSNLPSETIGEPTHDFILKPGDVLYMPRGTIHEANSPTDCDSHSTHITLSTYQKHSWGDYLLSTFGEIIENVMSNSEKFRKGLPIGYLQSPLNKDYFTELMNEIPKAMQSPLPSSQSLIEDFTLSRLPPFGIDPENLEQCPDGIPPKLESAVKLSYPKHTAFCIGQPDADGDEDEDDDDDDDGEENNLLVYTSIFNNRKNHMISSKDAVDTTIGTLKFPENYADAFKQLLSSEEFIRVKELKLDSDSEKEQFAMSLWAQHLLLVQ